MENEIDNVNQNSKKWSELHSFPAFNSPRAAANRIHLVKLCLQQKLENHGKRISPDLW